MIDQSLNFHGLTLDCSSGLFGSVGWLLCFRSLCLLDVGFWLYFGLVLYEEFGLIGRRVVSRCIAGFFWMMTCIG